MKAFKENTLKILLDKSAMSVELQQQAMLDISKDKKARGPASPKEKKGLQKTKSTLSLNGGSPNHDDNSLSKHFPYFKGYHTISSLSKAICTCSTVISKKQLFFYINELASHGDINVCELLTRFLII